MGFSNWLDRNGTKLVLTVSVAIVTGLFAMVSLFISELGQENRASIVQIREDMRQMRTEMREEMRNIRVVVDRVDTKIDRVDTKVDELAVLFKYHPVLLRDGAPPESTKP